MILLYLLILLSAAMCCSFQEVHFPLCANLSQMFHWFFHLSRDYLIRTPRCSPCCRLTLHLLPSGGPRRTINSPETMDVLPQSQAGMLFSRVQVPLQRAAQRLCPARPHSTGNSLLWHLWLGVVSAYRLFKVENAK